MEETEGLKNRSLLFLINIFILMCNVIKSPLTVQAIYHYINTIFFIYFTMPHMSYDQKYLFFWSELHTDCDFAFMPPSHIWMPLTCVRWIDSSFACCLINLFLWPVCITLHLSVLIFICLYTWFLCLTGVSQCLPQCLLQTRLHNYGNILLLKGPKLSGKTTACSAFVRQISSEVYRPII